MRFTRVRIHLHFISFCLVHFIQIHPSRTMTSANIHLHLSNTAAEMAEWKKKQAEVQKRMKEERKAESKRRRLEMAKEKRKNEREMVRQFRAVDPGQLRKLSAMGCLAAAAEAASKVDGSPSSGPPGTSGGARGAWEAVRVLRRAPRP